MWDCEYDFRKELQLSHVFLNVETHFVCNAASYAHAALQLSHVFLNVETNPDTQERLLNVAGFN